MRSACHKLTTNTMSTMRAIRVTPGNKTPSAMVLVHDEPIPTPIGRQVLIHVHFTAVNRADTLQRIGAYPVPPGESPILGLECSGTIVSRGAECINEFNIGDRVMALLGGGGYGEYAVADERSVMPIPAAFAGDMGKAAAVPETWLTAYQLIHFVARTQPSEHVVVHVRATHSLSFPACWLSPCYNFKLYCFFGQPVAARCGRPPALELVWLQFNFFELMVLSPSPLHALQTSSWRRRSTERR
jgi:hypothetical protein